DSHKHDWNSPAWLENLYEDIIIEQRTGEVVESTDYEIQVNLVDAAGNPVNAADVGFKFDPAVLAEGTKEAYITFEHDANTTVTGVTSEQATVTGTAGNTKLWKLSDIKANGGKVTLKVSLSVDTLKIAIAKAVAELEEFCAPLDGKLEPDHDTMIAEPGFDTWMDQYTSADQDETVRIVVGTQRNNIKAVSTTEADVFTTKMNAKIAVATKLMAVAQSNLYRLVNELGMSAWGQVNLGNEYDAIVAQVPKWNRTIHDAYMDFLTVINTPVELEDWNTGAVLTNIIEAYDESFATIKVEMDKIRAEDAAAEDDAKKEIVAKIDTIAGFPAAEDGTFRLGKDKTTVQTSDISFGANTNLSVTKIALTEAGLTSGTSVNLLSGENNKVLLEVTDSSDSSTTVVEIIVFVQA
ncbi:MAG: hypothetical protein HFF77_11445, partial [Oscillospiraceae bacterium]|nr:hypothetical protein [Oscillospiraceae bacterium]